MQAKNMQWVETLTQNTARSFYLTLRALPSSIRFPLSLGYLIARSTDTIVDEAQISFEQKKELFTSMVSKINQDDNVIVPFNLPDALARSLKDNEKSLLLNFNRLLQSLHELSPTIRNLMVATLNKIFLGQQQDLEHFKNSSALAFLATIDDLERYIYLQAGCIGEFWTDLCLKQLPHYSDLERQHLMQLAKNFGKGLQLVNILRDIPQDLNKGRCYLPLQQLTAAQINLDHLQKNPLPLSPIAKYWWQEAVSYLRDGWKYMLSINDREARFAISLPILLGFATLEKLADMHYLETKQHIKVSRRHLRRLMLIAFLGKLSKHFFRLVGFTKFRNLVS